MIDGTIVRAHRHAAGARGGQESQALGRSCGGFSSKTHAKVDALERPLNMIITTGHMSDIGQATALVKQDYCRSLIADRGYDCDNFRIALYTQGIAPIIPGRKNRTEIVLYNRDIYKERNAIERFFARIKECRRIATRYDKTVAMFRGALIIASILMWVKV